MPIWQRKYHIKLINDHYSEVKEEQEKQQSTPTSNKSPLGPAINPKGKTSYK